MTDTLTRPMSGTMPEASEGGRATPRVVLNPDLRARCYEPELMDADTAPRAMYERALYELEVINTWLGGYSTILAGLSEMMALGTRAARAREWHLADVGCGGGDTLRVIADWAAAHDLRVRLTGIDLQPICLDYARARSQGYAIDWVAADFRQARGPFDIVTTSQFCHHLDDALMREFFHWTRREARVGFVINDLHRHPLAYHAIHLLTALLSDSAFVRYDGPMSVRRAWQRDELLALAADARLHPRIRWKWAFRWLIMGYV